MAFYDEMAQTALEMLQEFGAPVTFTRVTPGTYDPDTGTTTPNVTTTWAGTAAILPASAGTIEAFDVRFQDGTLIETNLRALLVAALGLTNQPKPADTVTFADGSVWTSLGCTPLGPDGVTPLVYNVTVRK